MSRCNKAQEGDQETGLAR